ncbi:MAG: hypothetical protein OXF54_19855 [Caldilineaceae bacterium]|nr:hypothetical protein [Caldilineaceae bacterium]
MFDRKRLVMTTAVILALALTIALAPVAAAQAPNPPPPEPPPDETTPTPAPPPPPGGTGAIPPPPADTPAPATPGATATPAPPATGTGEMTPPSAPSWPPPNLIVKHAATQVQLTAVGSGLQSYLIGADGTGHSGPYIDAFTNLAQQHTVGVATLWTGANPGTGKPVTIYYLPAEKKVRISTFYPDTQYDTNKPYVFTIDSGHNVVHEQW